MADFQLPTSSDYRLPIAANKGKFAANKGKFAANKGKFADYRYFRYFRQTGRKAVM
jgi:hypothetical protein